MERHYGMDWLRIGAFALLILYHVGMFFVPWGWHVKTAEPLAWTTLPMLASNAWRLPLLFLVSGFASAALLGRSSGLGAFVRERSARLLVPLMFAILVIVPPQPWVELTTQHGYRESFLHFWTTDYFRFGTLAGIVLPTWQHLWFVVYLWVYTLALALLLAVTPSRAKQSFAGFADDLLGGGGLIWVPIAWQVCNLIMAWPGHAETHALIDDMPAHRIYFAAFAFGFFLRDAPRTWAAIRRWWRVAAALALAGLAVVLAIQGYWLAEPRPGLDLRLPFQLARFVQGWCTIVALIGVADRWWNRDHPWRATLTEAVFPFYIIHQTIIVLLGAWLLQFALPPGAEFLILVGATAAGCWLFYRAGRELGWARPLIGLKLARRAPSAKASAQPLGVP